MARFFNPNEPPFDYGYGPTIKDKGAAAKKKSNADDSPSTIRGTESGAYAGLEIGDISRRFRERNDIYGG